MASECSIDASASAIWHELMVFGHLGSLDCHLVGVVATYSGTATVERMAIENYLTSVVVA